MDSRDLQQQISESVARRGYRDGWTAAQFLARQVCKAAEELGEMAIQVEPLDAAAAGVMGAIATTGCSLARRAFDIPEWWGVETVVVNMDALRSEVADMQVVLCNIVAAIEEITSEPFDLLQAAASKAWADEGRGRREN